LWILPRLRKALAAATLALVVSRFSIGWLQPDVPPWQDYESHRSTFIRSTWTPPRQSIHERIEMDKLFCELRCFKRFTDDRATLTQLKGQPAVLGGRPASGPLGLTCCVIPSSIYAERPHH
jgi:hypothetical protein